MSKKLLVLSMSGGLDSSVLCARALAEGYTVLPITYAYGQKNHVESIAQSNIWNSLKIEYNETLLDTLSIDFTSLIGGAIQTFQKNRDNGKAEESNEMKYYFPSRNLLFMTVAAVIGETISIDESIDSISLGLGIHKHSDIYAKDYYDISPEFADKLGELLSLNKDININIYAPYKGYFKSEIIKDMIKYNINYELTWSCYSPEYISPLVVRPCDECEACLERSSQARESNLKLSINNYELQL